MRLDFDAEGSATLQRAVIGKFARDTIATASESTARQLRSAIKACSNLGPDGVVLGPQRIQGLKRRFILHVGPTNSGKTHAALVALAQARRGVYAGPLRLLAHEIYSRFRSGSAPGLDGVPRECNLLTGEERRSAGPHVGLTSCTVEMVSLTDEYDVAVLDEIQMIASTDRGGGWTNAVLGLRAKEIHCCGEASAVELVQRLAVQLGDDVEVRRYERLSPLEVSPRALGGDLTQLERGDCVVTFSRSNIFALKREIEATTGLRVAVAYGALPPDVREEQARGFNEQLDYDVMVATDAIGMGLNLYVRCRRGSADLRRRIRRIVFEATTKYNGTNPGLTPLPAPQIKQIAGRAGRYGLGSSAPSLPDAEKSASDQVGLVTTLNDDAMAGLVQGMSAPPSVIPRAALVIVGTYVDDLAIVARPGVSSADLYQTFSLLARPGADFYLPLGTHAIGLARQLERAARDLSRRDTDTFLTAPFPMRMPGVLETVQAWARTHAAGEVVDPVEFAHSHGLKEIESVLHADAIRQTEAADSDAAVQAMRSLRQASATTLVRLESMHKLLTCYAWLARRLQTTFDDPVGARQILGKCERAINILLAAGGRAATIALARREPKDARPRLPLPVAEVAPPTMSM